MADRVTDYALKSLAHHLDTDIATLDAAYVITPDFDWDHKPDPTSPGNKTLRRSLPFAGISIVNDSDQPFSVGNILYEKNIDVWIHVCGQTYTQLVQIVADIRQSLRSATNPDNDDIGIILYDFSTVDGAFYLNAGTMHIDDISATQYFGPEDKTEEDNRKYRAIIPLRMTAFKDVTATLLENMGRVNLTDL